MSGTILTARILFWVFTGLIVYTYLVYPMLAFILSCLFRLKLRTSNQDELFTVSMIISAYNEHEIIGEKIRNCQLIDYPREKIEFLIGSDGSTDGTDRIILGFSDQGFKLFSFKTRQGKVKVLNSLISQAKGEILVFSDANSMYEPGAVKELVKRFSDRRIGCVCGKLVLLKAAESAGGETESIYWKYENFLKRCEGRMGLLLGANGGIYAVRKNLFQPLAGDTIVDDFVIPMKILEKGYKVIYEPGAIAYEDASKKISDEMVRKTRIGAGDYQALLMIFPMLNILKGLPSFTYLSHKVLRWFVPFFLLFLLLDSVFLWRDASYRYLFLMQAFFYGLALIGHFAGQGKPQNKIVTIVYYFVAMNVSLFLGFFRFILGAQKTTWERVNR